MTTINIEGVIITPEVHSVLKEIQDAPEWLVSAVEDAESLILDELEDNPKRAFNVLKSLYSLKQNLIMLTANKEGGENESNR
jgi:hypothetical protein